MIWTLQLTFFVDTLAGQMAALKGQPTADPDKPKRQRKAPVKPVDDESDYESGTDEDEESESETDTDTDTEEDETKKLDTMLEVVET